MRVPATAAGSTRNVQMGSSWPIRLYDKCQSHRHVSRGRHGLQAGTAPSSDCRQNKNYAADLATRGLDRSHRAQASLRELLCQVLLPARVQILDTGQGPAHLAGISLQYKPIVTSLSLCKGTLS